MKMYFIKLILVFSVLFLLSCNRDTLRPNSGEYIHTVIDGANVDWNMPPDSIYSIQTPVATLQPILDSYYQSGFTNYTSIWATRPGDNYPKIAFHLQYNNVIGTYPLGQVFYETSPINIGIRVQPNSIVNITHLGVPGTGTIEGNFTTQIVVPPSNVPKTITCTFVVPRHL